jgi:Pyruvate/2-oxoacid:ferredoxin oxidoreductase gamma subunit
MANLVMLGALVNQLDMLSIEDIGASLDCHIPEHHRNLLEGNLKALKRGAALATGEKLAT